MKTIANLLLIASINNRTVSTALKDPIRDEQKLLIVSCGRCFCDDPIQPPAADELPLNFSQ